MVNKCSCYYCCCQLLSCFFPFPNLRTPSSLCSPEPPVQMCKGQENLWELCHPTQQQRATCGYLNLNSLKLKVGFSVTLAISQGLRDTMCLVTTTLDSIDTEYFYHPSKFYLTHWSGIFLSQHNSNPPSQWITWVVLNQGWFFSPQKKLAMARNIFDGYFHPVGRGQKGL